jgi:hypothetical protein
MDRFVLNLRNFRYLLRDRFENSINILNEAANINETHKISKLSANRHTSLFWLRDLELEDVEQLILLSICFFLFTNLIEKNRFVCILL